MGKQVAPLPNEPRMVRPKREMSVDMESSSNLDEVIDPRVSTFIARNGKQYYVSCCHLSYSWVMLLLCVACSQLTSYYDIKQMFQKNPAVFCEIIRMSWFE